MEARSIEDQLHTEYYEYLLCQPYRVYRMFGRTYYEDVCLIMDKPRQKLLFRLQKRWFGVTKAMEKQGETEGRWIVVAHYNIHREYMRRLYRVIRAMAEASRSQGNIGLESWRKDLRHLISGGDESLLESVEEPIEDANADGESAVSALARSGASMADSTIRLLEQEAIAEIRRREQELAAGRCFACHQDIQPLFRFCPSCGRLLRRQAQAADGEQLLSGEDAEPSAGPGDQ